MSRGRDALADLDELVPESVEELKETLRLNLAFNMAKARKSLGLSQGDLASIMGVSQSWISKLESPNFDHRIESVLSYVAALEGELKLSFRVGARDYSVCDYSTGWVFFTRIDLGVETADDAITSSESTFRFSSQGEGSTIYGLPTQIASGF